MYNLRPPLKAALWSAGEEDTYSTWGGGILAENALTLSREKKVDLAENFKKAL